MPNRRRFVKTMAGATAGLFAARGGFFGAGARAFQAGASRRRQVSIGGKRVKVVDVHGHFIEPSEIDVIKDTNLAPNISSQLNGPLVLNLELKLAAPVDKRAPGHVQLRGQAAEAPALRPQGDKLLLCFLIVHTISFPRVARREGSEAQ